MDEEDDGVEVLILPDEWDAAGIGVTVFVASLVVLFVLVLVVASEWVLLVLVVGPVVCATVAGINEVRGWNARRKDVRVWMTREEFDACGRERRERRERMMFAP